MNIEASFFSSLTVWFYRFSHSTVLEEIKAAICTTVDRNAVGVFSVHQQHILILNVDYFLVQSISCLVYKISETGKKKS